MLVIGLTGGIAMGKSTVSRVLATQVPVVDADILAREVVQPGKPAYNDVVRHFGKEVLLPSGELDRAALGRIVFADADARKALNGFTHPRVRRAMFRALFGHYLSGARACVLDVPLLLESGLHRMCGSIIVVHCDETEQIKRMVKRDGCEEEEAMRKVRAQASPAARLAIADTVLDNGTTEEALVEGATALIHPGPLCILPPTWWATLCRFPPIGLLAAIVSLGQRQYILHRGGRGN